jgi:hypothetical protein
MAADALPCTAPSNVRGPRQFETSIWLAQSATVAQSATWDVRLADEAFLFEPAGTLGGSQWAAGCSIPCFREAGRVHDHIALPSHPHGVFSKPWRRPRRLLHPRGAGVSPASCPGHHAGQQATQCFCTWRPPELRGAPAQAAPAAASHLVHAAQRDRRSACTSHAPPPHTHTPQAVCRMWRDAAKDPVTVRAAFRRHWRLAAVAGTPRRPEFLHTATLACFVKRHDVQRGDSLQALAGALPAPRARCCRAWCPCLPGDRASRAQPSPPARCHHAPPPPNAWVPPPLTHRSQARRAHLHHQARQQPDDRSQPHVPGVRVPAGWVVALPHDWRPRRRRRQARNPLRHTHARIPPPGGTAAPSYTTYDALCQQQADRSPRRCGRAAPPGCCSHRQGGAARQLRGDSLRWRGQAGCGAADPWAGQQGPRPAPGPRDLRPAHGAAGGGAGRCTSGPRLAVGIRGVGAWLRCGGGVVALRMAAARAAVAALPADPCAAPRRPRRCRHCAPKCAPPWAGACASMTR